MNLKNFRISSSVGKADGGGRGRLRGDRPGLHRGRSSCGRLSRPQIFPASPQDQGGH